MSTNLVSVILTLSLTVLGSLLGLQLWLKVCNIKGKDLHKEGYPLVIESGGVPVILGICIGLFSYVFLKTFLWKSQTHLLETYAVVLTVLLACFIGFIDDLTWKRGLRQSVKVLLTVPIAVPLMCINAGSSFIDLPFIGVIELGVLYPLIFIPAGVMGATNGFNLLAGYNGLEGGLGTLIFLTLGVASLSTGQLWIALICFIVTASLMVFLLFNWFPAKIFPGDSLTYPIGALVSIMAILGNMEKLALILFSLYFLEIILYLRARLIDHRGDIQAYALLGNRGLLRQPYDKIYDTTHLAIRVVQKWRGEVRETDVVFFVLLLQVMICSLGLAWFLWG